jgi:hypothetical protein
MKLTGHAFKRGSIVLLNGRPIDKKEVMKISENWSENLIKQFKKLLKHGGEILLEKENQHFIIKTDGPLLNSQGEKDRGMFKGPSIEDRF